MIGRILIGLGLAVFAAVVYAAGALLDLYGEPPAAGATTGWPRPPDLIAEWDARQQAIRQQAAIPADGYRHILFGDLRAQTALSLEAHFASLPLWRGRDGALPTPAEACDFARYCAGLDFVALTEDAASLSPPLWEEARQSVRQCNAVSDLSSTRDLITLLGYDWSSAPYGAATQEGRRTVVFSPRLAEEGTARPVRGPGPEHPPSFGAMQTFRLAMGKFSGRARYYDYRAHVTEARGTLRCSERLTPDCLPFAETAAALNDILAPHRDDTLVIAHGLNDGLEMSPGIAPQRIENADFFEIFSSNGNNEPYRRWRAVTNEGETPACPQADQNFEPGCRAAARIVEQRCLRAGGFKEECAARSREAEAYYLKAGRGGFTIIPAAEVSEWGDAGQCRDCFRAPFDHRPGGSTQALTAMSASGVPGFVATSGSIRAKPGTGYKELGRLAQTNAFGPDSPKGASLLYPPERAWMARALPPSLLWDKNELPPKNRALAASFAGTGGLTAVHTRGRTAGDLWTSLKDKRLYATSGPRILLWFDLMNAPIGLAATGPVPMGSEASMARPPRFQVTAVGAPVQKPGCPDYINDALSPQRLESLCNNECFNPSGKRHELERIEIVRIKAGDPDSIDDPWLSHTCTGDTTTCAFEFEDPDFAVQGGQFFYYARAIQKPTPTINGVGLRCVRDKLGRCIEAAPCYADKRTPLRDDCLAPAAERAWSSPIKVTYGRRERNRPTVAPDAATD